MFTIKTINEIQKVKEKTDCKTKLFSKYQHPKKPVRDIECHSYWLSDPRYIVGSWWNQNNIDQANARRKFNFEVDTEAHVPILASSRDER